MGKVITTNTNPMIGKSFKYKKDSITVIRTVLSEKIVKGQRLYYVSESNSEGVSAVDAIIHDRIFKTTTSRVHRKFKVKSMTQRRRA